jgi:hypothetical protein
VILFNHVVEILGANGIDFDGYGQPPEDLVDLFDSGCVASVFSMVIRFWDAIVVQCVDEGLSCSLGVSLVGKHETKGLTAAIYRTIQVHPFTADFDIGLIHTPGSSRAGLSFLRCAGGQG